MSAQNPAVWCEGDNLVIRAGRGTHTFSFPEARELFTDLGYAITMQEAARSKRPLESPTLENLLTYPEPVKGRDVPACIEVFTPGPTPKGGNSISRFFPVVKKRGKAIQNECLAILTRATAEKAPKPCAEEKTFFRVLVWTGYGFEDGEWGPSGDLTLDMSLHGHESIINRTLAVLLDYLGGVSKKNGRTVREN